MMTAILGWDIWLALLSIVSIALLIPVVIARIACERKRVWTARFMAAFSALLFVAIVIPGSGAARVDAQKRVCIANLKRLDGAKAQWAAEKKPVASATPQQPADLVPFLERGLLPVCPAGGTYTLGAVNEPPHCSLHARGHALDPALPKASP